MKLYPVKYDGAQGPRVVVVRDEWTGGQAYTETMRYIEGAVDRAAWDLAKRTIGAPTIFDVLYAAPAKKPKNRGPKESDREKKSRQRREASKKWGR
jgi:hypothetical protein